MQRARQQLTELRAVEESLQERTRPVARARHSRSTHRIRSAAALFYWSRGCKCQSPEFAACCTDPRPPGRGSPLSTRTAGDGLIVTDELEW
jgi:hypothetical protein